MRTRILVGALVVIAVVSLGAVARANVAGSRQWAVVNLPDAVLIKDVFVMGPVLIVHDDQKMARGEPCTTFYRFEPGKGPQEAIVSFHCKPVRRTTAATTQFTYSDPTPAGCKRLIEYQIGGDAEAHGIPAR